MRIIAAEVAFPNCFGPKNLDGRPSAFTRRVGEAPRVGKHIRLSPNTTA